MSLWSDFLDALRGKKPEPPPPPVPARREVHVAVLKPGGAFMDTAPAALVSGTMGTDAWTVTGVPLSGYLLSFTLPADVDYGELASIEIHADPGYLVHKARVVLLPDINVTMVATPSSVAARTGRVTLVGRAWTDAGGPFYPLYSSLLWAVGGLHRGEEDRVRQNLRFLAARGYGARILAQVDWKGEEIDPFWPDYPLARVIDFMYDECGERVKLTLFGGGCADPIAATRKVLGIVTDGRQHKVFLQEAVNEDNLPRAEAVAVARIIKASGVPTAVGWGDQGVEAIKAIGDEAGTNVDVMHSERTPPPARQARQGWDYHLFRRASDAGEPPGPGSSVAELTDPFWLAAMRADSVICGAGSFCLHTGSGVYGRTYQGPTSKRYANLWEIPNIDAMMAAVRNATVRFAAGMENWTATNTGTLPVVPLSGQFDKLNGCVRAGHFAEIVLDAHGPIVFRPAAADYGVYNPATGEPVDAATANLGAYLIVGTTR